MALLTMILTLPFLFIAYKNRKDTEEYLLLKFLGIWTVCQLYIILNSYYRLPIGLLIAVFIVYKSKQNRFSKSISLGIGTVSFLASSLIYVIFY